MIRKQDIIDFYVLYDAIVDMDYATPVPREVAFLINEIADRYKEAFFDLLYKQLEKYYERGRVDKDFVLIPRRSCNFSNILYMMNKTYRGDMKRRNTRWNMLAEYVFRISEYRNIDVRKTGFYIDRINNVVHNTKTTILDKFPNAEELIVAFDFAHKATQRALRAAASEEAREMADLVISKNKWRT